MALTLKTIIIFLIILLYMILKLFYLKPKLRKPNNFFDHFIVYDFETILSKTEIKKTENLQYTSKHVPVSFSIFSNVEGFNIKPIHVVINDPKELIDLFVSNLLEMSKNHVK
jgi:hypothetical protein